MAFSEALVERVRSALAGCADVEEKKMFRGVTFMVSGKMCVSVSGDRLMCRVGPEQYAEAVERDGVQAMVMRGRECIGYVYVDEDAVSSKKDFDYWIGLCLKYNASAKASPKKKRVGRK